MHPQWPDPDDASHAGSEELIVYALLVLVGAIPVAINLVQRAIFGVDATLGLIMVCLGAVGALVHVRRAHTAQAARAARAV